VGSWTSAAGLNANGKALLLLLTLMSADIILAVNYYGIWIQNK
jgi:hypothetical protein